MERLAYAINEVAAMLGLSRRSVERYIKAGLLQSVKHPGASRFIPATSLEAFLKGNPLEPTKQKPGDMTRRAE